MNAEKKVETPSRLVKQALELGKSLKVLRYDEYYPILLKISSNYTGVKK
jgi:hypothetical protein